MVMKNKDICNWISQCICYQPKVHGYNTKVHSLLNGTHASHKKFVKLYSQPDTPQILCLSHKKYTTHVKKNEILSQVFVVSVCVCVGG